MTHKLKRAALWAATLPRDYLRWHGAGSRAPASASPRVFYGFDRLPGPDNIGFGGAVKVQDLQRRFPNTPGNANLLYLISSYLPLFAPRLARWARRAGVGVILNQNGVGYPGWMPSGWRDHNRPMRAVLAQANYVVYQSRFCKETADRFLDPPPGEWEILLNPVDTAVFAPPDRDPDPSRFVVLAAGSHHFEYRVRTAIQAFAGLHRRLPEARLILAGRYAWRRDPADAAEEARQWIRDEKISDAVDLTGPYTQTEALSLFRRAHALLHTKYADPCPRLAAEAMACGLPVVYSASGGMPELVGDEAGIGIPAPRDYEQDHPPSPEALAEALVRIAADRDRFSRKARDRAVRLLDVQPWLDRHQILFEQFA